MCLASTAPPPTSTGLDWCVLSHFHDATETQESVVIYQSVFMDTTLVCGLGQIGTREGGVGTSDELR